MARADRLCNKYLIDGHPTVCPVDCAEISLRHFVEDCPMMEDWRKDACHVFNCSHAEILNVLLKLPEGQSHEVQEKLLVLEAMLVPIREIHRQAKKNGVTRIATTALQNRDELKNIWDKPVTVQEDIQQVQ